MSLNNAVIELERINHELKKNGKKYSFDYIAVDGDLEIFGFIVKPNKMLDGRWDSVNDCRYLGDYEGDIDWQDSLITLEDYHNQKYADENGVFSY